VLAVLDRADTATVPLGRYAAGGDRPDRPARRDRHRPAAAVRCARDSTDAVLRAVAGTPGVLGYTELGAAAARAELANPQRCHPA
jgi:hypothetical protein